MNPKKFLLVAGPVLISIGLLGITGILGKISSWSFFHPPYWINWVHLSLGILVLSTALWGNMKWQRRLTLLATILGLLLGVTGLLLGRYAATRFNIPELADPSDHIAHLTVGLFALWGLLGKKKDEFASQI